MPKTALTPTVLSLLLLLAPSAVAGCSTYGEGDDAAAAGANGASGSGANGGAEGPKAPPVSGTPVDDELVESLGVFVTPSGNDDGDGTRARPLARIQAGIDLGKKVGKRVYVCTGTYREALTLADSISVIGGLGCGKPDAWTSGQPKSRVEAPSSPALTAKGLTTDTRVEGLEIVAPDATEPSASSIGLFAVGSPKLVVAATTITAGSAANGVDGTDGVQLTQTGAPAGAATGGAMCTASTCESTARGTIWVKASGGAGGTSVCSGAPGYDGDRGSDGGSGGLHETYLSGTQYLVRWYRQAASYAPEPGVPRPGNGGAGASGAHGANPAELGAFSHNGYVPADGTRGEPGAPGSGGTSGAGFEPEVAAHTVPDATVFRGFGGAGGGAGGCPGLPGTAGTGGGASLAALLLESPIVLDGASLVAARGGDAGRGAFGSSPTPGGAPGANPFGSRPGLSGKPGGAGGAAGVSGNGSAGPSIALVSRGAMPTISGATTTTAGTPGAGVEERTRTDALGNTMTIPATPAGVAKATLAL